MSMTRKGQRGFTLIELIIFIVVVGIGVAGILSVYTAAIKNSADPLVRKQTLAIAESLLEEIVLTEYSKPSGSTAVGFASAGDRKSYDCVDDYNGYTTTNAIYTKADTTTAVAGLSSYSITPAVAVSATTLGTVTVKKIVVSVTGPQGVISVSGYRGNY